MTEVITNTPLQEEGVTETEVQIDQEETNVVAMETVKTSESDSSQSEDVTGSEEIIENVTENTQSSSTNDTQYNNDDETWKWQLKRVLLAGVGVVAVAQEEVEQFLTKLVDKGALAEQESKKWLKDFFDKGYQQTKNTVQTLEQGLGAMEGLLHKLRVPSKKEFETLSKRVEEISGKVDELSSKIQEIEK